MAFQLIDCTMFPHSCFVVVSIYLCLNIMMGTLCQAFDDDDHDSSCSSNYVFYQNDGSSTDWIPLRSSPCTLKSTRSAKGSVLNLPSNNECTKLDDVCGKFKRALLRTDDDDSNLPFMKINMLQIFDNQSYRLVYFEDEESCTEIIYAEEDTVGKLPSPSVTLLICQNITHDDQNDPDKLQTESPANRITTIITPINEARRNGVDNSTSEVDNVAKNSAVLMYVAYALTGVAILSAIMTLSVCCVSHHKRRKRTVDNGHYDAEYNLTVEQGTPPPQQTEVNDHTRPDPTGKAKVKLEFNNAIYNTSGLITKVIIQPATNQDSNSNLEYSDAGQGARNVPVPHQNGECQKSGAEQPHIPKSIKDTDKVGTSTFPTGEYQEFAVELKSTVRRVLSNPTYVHEDDVIRSPICAKPGRQMRTKAISSDNIQLANVGLSVPIESSKSSHAKMICPKEGPGNCKSESEYTTNKDEKRTHNSPEDKRMIDDGLRIGDKYPAIQPRDMSYMYVQLPKEWSKNIPIEEPTVPYASTDITTTNFKHVPVKSKNSHSARRLKEDDGVYETYDRRT